MARVQSRWADDADGTEPGDIAVFMVGTRLDPVASGQDRLCKSAAVAGVSIQTWAPIDARKIDDYSKR